MSGHESPGLAVEALTNSEEDGQYVGTVHREEASDVALVPGEYVFNCLECGGEGSVELVIGEDETVWETCRDCTREGIQLLDEEEAAERIECGYEPLRSPAPDRGRHPRGKRMECPRCFQTFDLDEARASFNHQYSGSSDWQYDAVISEPLCWDCASTDADERWMEGTLEAADGPPPSPSELKKLRRRLGF